jgi:Beta-lactamase enzyme family
VFDAETGRTWLLRPGDLQATASIVKVDILATLLAQQRPAGTLPPSATQETAAEMIEESDNDAATDLWEAVGGPLAIESFDRQLGMGHTFPSACMQCPGFAWPGWGLTLTSASDQVTLVRDLVFSDRWFSPAQRAWALGLMEHVVPAERWGVSSGAPEDVVVALKNGWVPLASGLWQIDSIGWVDGAGRDYVAAVLSTANPTEQYGIETVDAVGSDLYLGLGP